MLRSYERMNQMTDIEKILRDNFRAFCQYYPQYYEYESTLVLGKIRRDISIRGRKRFSKDEYVLYDTEVHFPECGPYTRIAFVYAFTHEFNNVSIREAWISRVN